MPTEPGPAETSTQLDPRTITLVQETAALLHPIADAVTTLFYDRLFSLDPSLRTMFAPDTTEQKRRLMQTLGVLVNGIRDPDSMRPVLEQLGVRHVGYMVTEHHYELFGDSLLWTLQEALGDTFSEEVEAAWMEVYALVSGIMRRAAGASALSVSAARPSLRPILPAASPAAAGGAWGASVPSDATPLASTQTSTIRPPTSRPGPASISAAPSARRTQPPAGSTPHAVETAAVVSSRRNARVNAGQEVTVNLRIQVDIDPVVQLAADRAVERVTRAASPAAAGEPPASATASGASAPEPASSPRSETDASRVTDPASPRPSETDASRVTEPVSLRHLELSGARAIRRVPPRAPEQDADHAAALDGSSAREPSRAMPPALLLLAFALPVLSAATAGLTLVLLAGPTGAAQGAMLTALAVSLATSLLVSLALVAGYLAGVLTRAPRAARSASKTTSGRGDP